MATPILCYMPIPEGTPIPGGPPMTVGECGVIALPTTQSYVDVVFTFTKPDAEYALELSVENNVDSPANLLWVTLVTNRTTTGFRVWFNANPPTANYRLRWCAGMEAAAAPPPGVVNQAQFGASFRIRQITGGVVFETLDPITSVWTEVQRYMA